MFCTKCGKEIKEGMKHCPFCGEIVKKGNTAKAAVSSNEKKKLKKTKIILIIIALLLIGGLYNAVTENEGGKSLEYSFEVSDDDLLNLLGMANKDVEKLVGEPPRGGSPLIWMKNGIMIMSKNKNSVTSVHISGESTGKICGISIGDKENDVIEQMNLIGANLDEKEKMDEYGDPESHRLGYSIKTANNITLKFNWIFNSYTKRFTTGSVSIE
ncbi:MAG: zinc ribbon domain-containing protein [Lachnospiraceae bacterium]|jgi:hypothetical protein|nr:zinc ribbon domain-containing protein [Lachnospiraceae bacterium]